MIHPLPAIRLTIRYECYEYHNAVYPYKPNKSCKNVQVMIKK